MSGLMVTGAAGGCGTTTLACALAVAGTAGASRPLLADLGAHGGGPADLWGLPVTRSLDDLLPLGDAIADGHVEHLVHRHACGVDVMAGSSSPASASAWAGQGMEALVAQLAARAAWVADAGRGDTPLAQAMSTAGRVVLLVPSTVEGARAGARALDAVGAGGVLVATTEIPGGQGMSRRALQRALGCRVAISLPRDARGAADIAAARAPRGRGLARSLHELLEAL